MKRFVLLVIAILSISIKGFTQVYPFENLTSFDLLDGGAIVSQEEVQGYYFFFKKSGGKQSDSSEFILRILDNNLNELTNKEYKSSPETNVEGLVFNGKSIMVKEFSPVGNAVKFKVYDLNINGDLTFLKEQTIRESEDSRSMIYGVPDKGFVNIYGTSNKRAIVEYYDNGELKWTYNTPDETKWEFVDLITAYENKAFFSVQRYNKVTQGGDYFISCYDIDTGELLFEKVLTAYGYDHEVDKGFVNPIKDEVWLTGDYFVKGHEEKIMNSEGLFVMRMNLEGEILDSDYAPWDGKIERYSKTYKKGKIKDGFLHMEDFVFLKEGQVFGIAEQYRKAFRAWGIAETVVTAGTSGRLIKVEIGDMLIFRFGTNAKLVETKRNRKPTKTVLPEKGLWGGLLIPGKRIGEVMEDQHAFDFSHVQIDNDHEYFTAFYYTKEELSKKMKKKYNRDGRYYLRSITYKDGNWTRDKFMLTDGKKDGITVHVLPAKTGYVLVYEESEDYRGLRLEKLK